MKTCWLILALVVVGTRCASTTPPPVNSPRTEAALVRHEAVLSELCSSILFEQVATEPVYVAKDTQPLLTASVLVALRVALGEVTRPDDFEAAERDASRLNAGTVSFRVRVPSTSRCNLISGDPPDEHSLALALSSPFNWGLSTMPRWFVVGRLTLGNQAPTWVALRVTPAADRVIETRLLPIDD